MSASIYRPGDIFRDTITSSANVTAVAAGVFRRNGTSTTAPTLSLGSTGAKEVTAAYTISSGYTKDDVLEFTVDVTTASGTERINLHPPIRLAAANAGIPQVDSFGRVNLGKVYDDVQAAQGVQDTFTDYLTTGVPVLVADMSTAVLNAIRANLVLTTNLPNNFSLFAIGSDGVVRAKDHGGNALSLAGDLTTLLGRIPSTTPTRLAYLDNLNIGGLVFKASDYVAPDNAGLSTLAIAVASVKADTAASVIALASLVTGLGNLAAATAVAAVKTVVDAILVKTDKIPDYPAAVGSPMTLTAGERNAVADATLDRVNSIETGLTLRKALRVIAAVLAGKVTISGNTVTIRNIGDTKTRVTATTTTDGERTAVIIDPD